MPWKSYLFALICIRFLILFLVVYVSSLLLTNKFWYNFACMRSVLHFPVYIFYCADDRLLFYVKGKVSNFCSSTFYWNLHQGHSAQGKKISQGKLQLLFDLFENITSRIHVQCDPKFESSSLSFQAPWQFVILSCIKLVTVAHCELLQLKKRAWSCPYFNAWSPASCWEVYIAIDSYD